jgi:crotonobetainyl-CoA:carnitine CoA-transferase CaiB-like acyl-CoA transferase
LPGFQILNKEEYKLNEGRIKDVSNLNKQIEEITVKYSTDELLKMLKEITVPASKINAIEDVLNDKYLHGKFIETEDEKTKLKITLSPPGHNTDFLNKVNRKLSFPPRLGEHNLEIYRDLLGLTKQELSLLKNERII